MLKRSTAVRLGALLLVSVLPYALLRIPAARSALLSFVAYVRGAGLSGAVALLGFDVVWALAAAPIWVSAAVAGYVYGFPVGIAVVAPSATIASCVAFLFGRLVSSRFLPDREAGSARELAVRRAIEADGRRIAFLLRLTPLLPQNVLTYVMASTSLSLVDFALASAGGLLPLLAFNAYVGSLVGDAAALLAGEAPDVGAARWIGIGGGLLAAGIAIVVIARVARRALGRAIEAAGDGGSPRAPAP